MTTREGTRNWLGLKWNWAEFLIFLGGLGLFYSLGSAMEYRYLAPPALAVAVAIPLAFSIPLLVMGFYLKRRRKRGVPPVS